ncbi:DNA polymerase III subunit delta [Marinobacterium jannaschii]|uniref:DNA polymerase III subunit delta n=1 Tax=Marinobacterium jannaschii TaxID=64970 RepID=UPI00048988B0|nr:DNA polymerase III subunit delta [Marinobacterium jannaschii]
MKLRQDQLASRLNSNVAPVYLICGDEPLLSEESSDTLRHHFQKQGFTEREVLHVESGFKWEYLLECANALSLFAERKIIELRLGSQKLNKQSSEILREYLSNPGPDNVLLIIAGKLDAAAKKSAWFKAIDKEGVIVEIWPVEADQLAQWIRQRAAQLGLQMDNSAVQLLCDRIEGNLLAAKQELAKLQLLFGNQPLDAETVMDAVSDSSRYDIYGLTDAALQGNAGRCNKILQVLKQDGTEPPIVLWALSREIRALIAVQQGLSQGMQYDTLCQREKIWGKRKNLVRRAAQKLPTTALSQLLGRCGEIDKTIKGAAIGDPWLLLSEVILGLCGIRLALATH